MQPIETKSRLEVIRPRELIVIHDARFNYGQLPREAIAELPYNNSLIASRFLLNRFPLKRWNGRKTGVVEVPALHLVRAGKRLSTPNARQFVRDQGLVPCVPAEIVPIKAHCQELWDNGAEWIVALDSDDKRLWRDYVVYLDCCRSSDFRGFKLQYNYDIWDHFYLYGREWSEEYWFAGLPQVSLVTGS